MKRKESESLFTSKKRARFAQAAPNDEDVMDLDLNEHAKDEKHINNKSVPGMLVYIYKNASLKLVFQCKEPWGD